MLMRFEPGMQDITELFEPVVQSMAYELVGVEFVDSGTHRVLRVYIDRPEGITVDDCAAVSHQLSALLEVEDPIGQAYDLEVSSPGLDRPLFRLADFERFKGYQAKIKMLAPIDGRKNFNGTINDVSAEGTVTIGIDNDEFELPLADIRKANLMVVI